MYVESRQSYVMTCMIYTPNGMRRGGKKSRCQECISQKFISIKMFAFSHSSFTAAATNVSRDLSYTYHYQCRRWEIMSTKNECERTPLLYGIFSLSCTHCILHVYLISIRNNFCVIAIKSSAPRRSLSIFI